MSAAETAVRPASASAAIRGPKFGVVRFPGSNCDQDAYFALKDVLGVPVEYLWHADRALRGVDIVVLPGGFSYGDYLRTGAVARFAPIMEAVVAHAASGRPVIGICNGFQVLCEAHLLPGALVRNAGLKFVCKFVNLRVENARSQFTCAYSEGQVLKIPVAHGEGRYVCDEQTLARLTAGGQILFRYTDPHGLTTSDANPNGSLGGIAGIANEAGNVMGMMPHPERACEKILGSADGRGIFGSLIAAASARA
ncbi:MAG TPA: phosphoribosylformylglycinamidine synthase subunit PurQ [Chthonomonadaceae bacterium]|nr:phosphoribosylformylglycinamidine synthase subunit PurQ [Chthonomonadaceae bacterium]